MTVYMCEPWLEGILCGVYDAWSEPAGHGNVRLAVKGEYEEGGTELPGKSGEGHPFCVR